MKTGIELIAEERQRQTEKEGWSQKHDNCEHSKGNLSIAAAYYAINKLPFRMRLQYFEPDDMGTNDSDRGYRKGYKGRGWIEQFPFTDADKREKHDRLKSLVVAGALIAAEIDRINFINSNPPKP